MAEREYLCDKCSKVHHEVAVINTEEINSLRFLNTRIETAQKWIKDPSSNSNVVKSALQLESDTIIEVQKWWNEISKKYDFNINTYDVNIDFDTGSLYYFKD